MNLRTRRASNEEPEISLVAFIDVILMLVIFFLLSSTFVQEGRVKIRLPQASSVPTTKPKSDPLVISVTEQGGYRVNGRELINASPETLRAALVKEAGTDRSMRVTVRADARSTHQAVITAMDVLGRLGFVEISIATVKDEGPAGIP